MFTAKRNNLRRFTIKMKTLFLTSSLIISSIFGAYAQTGNTEQRWTPTVEFEKVSHNFGSIPEGPKAEYDFKNTKTGEVVQSMPVEIVEVYKDDNGNYVVVGKSESGSNWVFGTDDNKFHSLDDLRKI
jgi:hypothetical protein